MRLHPVSGGLCTCWVSMVLVVSLSDAGQDVTFPRVPGARGATARPALRWLRAHKLLSSTMTVHYLPLQGTLKPSGG